MENSTQFKTENGQIGIRLSRGLSGPMVEMEIWCSTGHQVFIMPLPLWLDFQKFQNAMNLQGTLKDIFKGATIYMPAPGESKQ